jgi:hypothetical protein
MHGLNSQNNSRDIIITEEKSNESRTSDSSDESEKVSSSRYTSRIANNSANSNLPKVSYR